MLPDNIFFVHFLYNSLSALQSNRQHFLLFFTIKSISVRKINYYLNCFWKKEKNINIKSITVLVCDIMSNDLEKLDDIDKRIIQLLQKNSRMTLVDMAQDINELTENAIRYRIDKLEDEGYIANYTIQLNPKKFGRNVMAIFSLNVMPENIKKVLEYLKSIDDLTEIYLTTGTYSIIAIGYFENNNAVTRFIMENLKNVKMIDYDVITILEKVKHELYGI